MLAVDVRLAMTRMLVGDSRGEAYHKAVFKIKRHMRNIVSRARCGHAPIAIGLKRQPETDPGADLAIFKRRLSRIEAGHLREWTTA